MRAEQGLIKHSSVALRSEPLLYADHPLPSDPRGAFSALQSKVTGICLILFWERGQALAWPPQLSDVCDHGLSFSGVMSLLSLDGVLLSWSFPQNSPSGPQVSCSIFLCHICVQFPIGLYQVYQSFTVPSEPPEALPSLYLLLNHRSNFQCMGFFGGGIVYFGGNIMGCLPIFPAWQHVSSLRAYFPFTEHSPCDICNVSYSLGLVNLTSLGAWGKLCNYAGENRNNGSKPFI